MSEGQPWLQVSSMATKTQPTQGLSLAQGQHWNMLSGARGAFRVACLTLWALAAARPILISTPGSLQGQGV